MKPDPSRKRQSGKAGWVHPAALPKGPAGKALCRQCGTEVDGRRLTFCSDACVSTWKIAHNPGEQRRAVERRDHGVCRACGIDTEAVKLGFLARWNDVPPHPVMPAISWPMDDAYRSAMAAHGNAEVKWWRAVNDVRDPVLKEMESAGWCRFTARGYHEWPATRSWWEMDHVLEVFWGGGGAQTLDNLQTLCRPCHARKTARLAAERAWLRRIGAALVRLGTPGCEPAVRVRAEPGKTQTRWDFR